VRIPRSLKIRKSMWRVILNKNAFDSTMYNGLCVSRSHKIFVDPRLPRNDVEMIFIHELLHACFPFGIVGYHNEERIVKKLAETLYAAMRDGKLLRPGTKRKSTKSNKKTRNKH
jgi:hypothetical protein